MILKTCTYEFCYLKCIGRSSIRVAQGGIQMRPFFLGPDNLEHEFRNKISDTITDLVVEGSSGTNKHVHCACCHTTQYTNNDAMYSILIHKQYWILIQ